MSRRLRLFLTTDAVGGVWTYSLELAAALVEEADVTVLLATVGPPPSPEQHAEAGAIPGLELVKTELPLDWTSPSADDLRAAAEELARLAAATEADAVQLHAPAFAAAHYRVPVLSVVHSCVSTWWEAVRGTSLPEDFAWRMELAREGLNRSALVVTPTRAFARAVQHVYRLATSPAAVHNGRFAPSFGFTAEGSFGFTAGRLWDEGKNIAAFDRAAGLANVPFRAAGPLQGPNGAAIRMTHAEPLGSLSPAEIIEQLAARPIFVSPALYEPFGLSVLEAAQAGCALVLADIPTFRELWEGAALLIDPTPEEIAATVDLLAGSPEERTRLGNAAQERAARYTPEVTARTMLGHYRTLLGPERRAAA